MRESQGTHMIPRQRVSSGSPYEPRIGFCRAVRVGNRVLVSGTAPVQPEATLDSTRARHLRSAHLALLAPPRSGRWLGRRHGAEQPAPTALVW